MKGKIIIIIFLMVLSITLKAQEQFRSDSMAVDFPVQYPSMNDAIKPLSLPFSLENVLKSPDYYKIPFPSPDSLPPTWSIFKWTFLDLPLPEEFAMAARFYRNMELGKNYRNKSIWHDPDVSPIENWNRERSYGGGLSTSIFQEIYDEFSHEGKMKRKYDTILQQNAVDKQIFAKYNVALVKQIAGFSNDSTAYAFMRFCDFKNDTLLQANNYDALIMIQNCLSQFLKLEKQ